MAWDDRYERQYGFLRPYVRDVICRYLDCGDLHLGFALVLLSLTEGHIYMSILEDRLLLERIYTSMFLLV